MKQETTAKVKDEKTDSQKHLQDKTAAAPDTSGIEPKPVKPVPAANPGKAPPKLGAEQAVPKAKQPKEVEAPLEAESKKPDQEMAAAEVTEEQLKKSNEPEFKAVLSAKTAAKTHAAEASQEYRQLEREKLNQAEMEAVGTAQKQTRTMYGDRAKLLTQVKGQQGEAKSKDEQARAKVASDIQKIYDTTKTKVDNILKELDGKVEKAFDQGAAAAKQFFENYVDLRMRRYKSQRYGGKLGGLRWAKDKLFGMPDEVNIFYEEGRELYLQRMDAVIDNVVNIIGAELTRAKTEIAQGKKKIQDYVAKLPDNLKSVGEEAAADIQTNFEELEETVNSKQDALIDTLAQKYQENLKAVDDRINQMKEANKGLVAKAIGAIKAVIETIRKLKQMLAQVLARISGVIGLILKDPIKFFKNLIAGLKQGFNNFVDNIAKHLQAGLIAWLTGALGPVGIQIPDDLFSLKGIFSLVMQVLGLTWDYIRKKAVKLFGEKVVAAMEKTVEIFQVLQKEGPAGLWEYIKEQFSNLKEMVMDQIKDMVITEVIKAGVKWILSLLNPVAAFIKAAMAIYNIIMFFVERAAQIADFINSVIDAIAAIAKGALAGAAKLVENALAKSIPLIIGMLAALLGISGLAKKVQKIIQRIRKRIDKAIDKLLMKVKGLFKGKKGQSNKDKKGKISKDTKHDQQLKEGLQALEALTKRYAQDGADKEEVTAGVKSVRRKFKVFKSIKVIDGGDTWNYEYVASPKKQKKGVKKAGKLSLSSLSGWRPKWRKSTNQKLKAKYPEGFYKNKLKLKKGFDRRHKVAFEVIFKDLKAKIEGKTYPSATKELAKIGYKPNKQKEKQILSASKKYLRDKFNDPDNVWVGESEENQEKGRQMARHLKQLEKLQNELRSLLKNKPINKAGVRQKNKEITKVINELEKARLDVPRGKLVKAAYKAMLKAQKERELAESSVAI